MATILLNGSHPRYLVNFRGLLVRDMLARGHTVHVSSPDLSGLDAQYFTAMGASTHDVALDRTRTSAYRDWQYMRQIVGLIRKTNADFVLNYTIKPNIWGSLAAKHCGVQSASMVTGLGFTFIDRPGIARKLLQKIARNLYRLATNANRYVVFQNPDDRDDFVASGCLKDQSKAILVNGSGIDTEHFLPVPLPEAPVFLVIARLLYSKGLEEFVQASEQVRVKHPTARFQLAGMLDSGPDAITRETLNNWKARGIEYLGVLDDVRPAISNASIYVLPSWREGTPRTVLEAMSMGRPIITTDVPGCRETTAQGENGLLVPVRQPPSLAHAMSSLATNAVLRREMGAASRRIACKKYAVEKVNSALLDGLSL